MSTISSIWIHLSIKLADIYSQYYNRLSFFHRSYLLEFLRFFKVKVRIWNLKFAWLFCHEVLLVRFLRGYLLLSFLIIWYGNEFVEDVAYFWFILNLSLFSFCFLLLSFWFYFRFQGFYLKLLLFFVSEAACFNTLVKLNKDLITVRVVPELAIVPWLNFNDFLITIVLWLPFQFVEGVQSDDKDKCGDVSDKTHQESVILMPHKLIFLLSINWKTFI